MPKITLLVGVLLVIEGLGFYVATGTKSITALIPTFVGLPILVLGILAFNASREDTRCTWLRHWQRSVSSPRSYDCSRLA